MKRSNICRMRDIRRSRGRAALAMQGQGTLPEGGKARRVYLLLRDEISNGVFPPGTLLPGENRLAETFGVSRVTIRRALETLTEDGWIEKRTGAGSVVLPRGTDPAISADFAALIPQLVQIDRATTARLLSFSYGPAPDAIAEALALPPGARVQRAVRVRLSDGRPFSHLTTYVPEEIAENYGEADLATQPLFRLLERSGVRLNEAHQSVSATLAAPDVADDLGVSVGAALLSLRRVVRDDTGRGVEYLSALYRPDLFRLEMTMTRVGTGEARHWEPVIGGTGA